MSEQEPPTNDVTQGISDRISHELPVIPHSLRAFIEGAVTNDRQMMAFVEAPGAALRAAGIPIDTRALSAKDTDGLRDVLGNLRNAVTAGLVNKDFRFEDVFKSAGSVAYQEQRSTSETYAYHNFDHSTDGQSSENKSHTEGGIKADFSKAGLGRMRDINLPMINPEHLSRITEHLQEQIRQIRQQ